jgi:hypothetical protein
MCVRDEVQMGRSVHGSAFAPGAMQSFGAAVGAPDLMVWVSFTTIILTRRMLSQSQQATAATAPLKFEVASVKPSPPDMRKAGGGHGVDLHRTTIPLGRCIFHHANLRTIIKQAYPLNIVGITLLLERVIGGPAWIDGSPFDIEAKAEDPETTTIEQLRQMLRTY